jgi:hypothetical protein
MVRRPDSRRIRNSIRKKEVKMSEKLIGRCIKVVVREDRQAFGFIAVHGHPINYFFQAEASRALSLRNKDVVFTPRVVKDRAFANNISPLRSEAELHRLFRELKAQVELEVDAVPYGRRLSDPMISRVRDFVDAYAKFRSKV